MRSNYSSRGFIDVGKSAWFYQSVVFYAFLGSQKKLAKIRVLVSSYTVTSKTFI